MGRRFRGLGLLAVDDADARAGLPADTFPVHRQVDVMGGAEQHQPHETPEPTIGRLPGQEVLRQHVPAAVRTRHVADRVQCLAHLHARLASAPRRRWKQRRETGSFSIGRIGWVAPRLTLDVGFLLSTCSA